MSNINVLAFSDIHNNVRAVETLRNKEKGSFDAVVIAGDIGDEKAKEILEIISDYDCPVLYVYGNWDNKLSYSKKFTQNCFHIHQKSILINGYHFTGFSGCPAHWGRNPIAKTFFLNVENNYNEHLQEIDNLQKEIGDYSQPFEKEIEKAEILYEERLNGLNKKERQNDKEIKKLEKIIALNNEKIDNLNIPYHRLLTSKKHSEYEMAIREARKTAEKENRRILINQLKDEGSNLSKTFLVTHERLYKTHIDAPDLFCHMFGHRHGFKHTVFKGTNFINVSVLDDENVWRESDSTYCILKANNADLEVYCKSIINND